MKRFKMTLTTDHHLSHRWAWPLAVLIAATVVTTTNQVRADETPTDVADTTSEAPQATSTAAASAVSTETAIPPVTAETPATTSADPTGDDRQSVEAVTEAPVTATPESTTTAPTSEPTPVPTASASATSGAPESASAEAAGSSVAADPTVTTAQATAPLVTAAVSTPTMTPQATSINVAVEYQVVDKEGHPYFKYVLNGTAYYTTDETLALSHNGQPYRLPGRMDDVTPGEVTTILPPMHTPVTSGNQPVTDNFDLYGHVMANGATVVGTAPITDTFNTDSTVQYLFVRAVSVTGTYQAAGDQGTLQPPVTDTYLEGETMVLPGYQDLTTAQVPAVIDWDQSMVTVILADGTTNQLSIRSLMGSSMDDATIAAQWPAMLLSLAGAPIKVDTQTAGVVINYVYKRVITVTGPQVTKTEDGQPYQGPLTATVTGVPTNGDPVAYTMVPPTATAVGQYPIEIQLGDNPNYMVNVVAGTLAILPATPVQPGGGTNPGDPGTTPELPTPPTVPETPSTTPSASEAPGNQPTSPGLTATTPSTTAGQRLAHDRAVSLPTAGQTPSVTPTDDTRTPSATTTDKTALPQTNEPPTPWWVAGLGALFGLIGLRGWFERWRSRNQR